MEEIDRLRKCSNKKTVPGVESSNFRTRLLQSGDSTPKISGLDSTTGNLGSLNKENFVDRLYIPQYWPHYFTRLLTESQLAQSVASSAWKPEVVGSNPTKSNWDPAVYTARIFKDSASTLCLPVAFVFLTFLEGRGFNSRHLFFFNLLPLPPCFIFSFFLPPPPPLSKSYKRTFLYFLKANLRFESISLNSAIGE